METANLPSTPTPRLPLLGRAFRPRADARAFAPEHNHLHFDRASRIWLSHDEREPRDAREPLSIALPECA